MHHQRTKSSSQPSLSPRSSLSSVSPPVSPYDPPPPLPPSYEQAYLSSQERLRTTGDTDLKLPAVPNPSRSVHSPVKRSPAVSPLKPSPACRELELSDLPYSFIPPPSLLLNNRRSGQESVGSDQSSAPLSPISETATYDDRKTMGGGSSGGAARSVSAAVSDESVAGDSGVFEAAARPKDGAGGLAGLAMNLETAQVAYFTKEHKYLVRARIIF